jgi:hypothetical protein
MFLFINDNTCGSGMMGHHLIFSKVRQHLNKTFGEKRIGDRGLANRPAWYPDLNLLQFSAVETPKDFGAFSAVQ